MENLYKMVLFDMDGTLTPQRDGSHGPTIFELLPGVKEKVAELRCRGVILGVCSNQSSIRPIREIVRHFEWVQEQLHFGLDNMLYSTSVRTRKPDPYMLQYLMHLHEVFPDECLFVGDAETDKQAAEASGCDFVYACEYFSGTPMLSVENCVEIIKQLVQVLPGSAHDADMSWEIAWDRMSSQAQDLVLEAVTPAYAILQAWDAKQKEN